MNKYINDFLIIIKKYAIYISMFLSFLLFILSLFDYDLSYLCYEYVDNNGFYEYSIKKIECPKTNDNIIQMTKFIFLFYIFCVILYLLLYLVKIKHFFDKYLLSSSTLFVFMSSSVYSSFEFSRLSNFLFIVIFILLLFFLFISIKTNILFYRNKLKKVIYLISILGYSFFIFVSCCIYSLSRSTIIL